MTLRKIALFAGAFVLLCMTVAASAATEGIQGPTWSEAARLNLIAYAPVSADAAEVPQTPGSIIDTGRDLYAFASTDRSFYGFAMPEQSRIQHRWGGERYEPLIDPSRVTQIVYGWSRHVGSKRRGSSVPIQSRLNEQNPGLGWNVSFGICYGERFECHATVVYIDQNSLRGKAVTIGFGMNREIFRLGNLTISGGFEAFLMSHRAGYRDKKIVAPLVLPTGSMEYKIDAYTSIGIGVEVLPFRAGDAKRIEIYNIRVKSLY